MGNKLIFYEYIDIIDPSIKFKEIEERGKNENRYSWSILVEEIKKKVIRNDFINDFIEKTEKNIKFSNIYYKSINKYIDLVMEKKNEENQENFYLLQKLILLESLEDKKFYLLQKNKIYQDMVIILKLYNKINKTKGSLICINKLKEFIHKKLEIFIKRKDLINLINKKSKNGFMSNEDNIIINIQSENDIILALDFIDNNKKIYTNIKLPIFIKIRENNNYPVNLNNEKNKTNDYYIIYKYIKATGIINNKKYNTQGEQTDLIIKYFKNNINKIPNDLSNSLYILFKKCLKYIFSNGYINSEITQATDLNFIKIINLYKYVHYFDLWRKKHIYQFTECGVYPR